MQIECIDMWYLKEPVVEDIGDGSQDALIIRLNLSGHIGWGECEAAPLTTIAAMFAPMSHAACKPIFYDLVGRDISGPESIKKLSSEVKRNTMDHLQAPHAWSGIEMALWDALGKAVETPVWELLGYKVSHGKRPYASSLFGETPEETYYKGKELRDKGFFAAKFGWAQFGMKDLSSDVQQLHAAREGVGPDLDLFIDAGQIFEGRFEEAKERLSALESVKAGWFEEPFGGQSYASYLALKRCTTIRLAGGEASHSYEMAINCIEYGSVDVIQIDCGRIGGIWPATEVAKYAQKKKIQFVNHTFTSHLALSASLQPFAGIQEYNICEYPSNPKPLAREIAGEVLLPSANTLIYAPESPGLGVEVNIETLKKYSQNVKIEVSGKILYETPVIDS